MGRFRSRDTTFDSQRSPCRGRFAFIWKSFSSLIRILLRPEKELDIQMGLLGQKAYDEATSIRGRGKDPSVNNPLCSCY